MTEEKKDFLDMSKYDTPKAQKMRADLQQIKADLYRKQYEYNMLTLAYNRMNKQYEDLVGITDLEKEVKNA